MQEDFAVDAEELIERLGDVGAHRDVLVKPEKLEEAVEGLSETGVCFYENANSFRDGNSIYTVHLTDHRGSETPRDCIVCHLEWFNPEDHPLLHALFDFPAWVFHNRVRGKETWGVEGLSD